MTIHEYIETLPKTAAYEVVDGKINADGDVWLKEKHIVDGKFPFPWRRVIGDFNCARLFLTSLDGALKR